MKPLVSILIPAYNAEPWIAETIRSAIGQTWPNKEIIVVDDGSTDQTLSIVQELLPKRYLLLLRKTRACARRETGPTSFAREITFNGWMRTIFCHETRSQNKWRQRSKVKANERCFLQLGDFLFFGPAKPALFQPHSGATYLRLNGCSADGRKIST